MKWREAILRRVDSRRLWQLRAIDGLLAEAEKIAQKLTPAL